MLIQCKDMPMRHVERLTTDWKFDWKWQILGDASTMRYDICRTRTMHMTSLQILDAIGDDCSVTWHWGDTPYLHRVSHFRSSAQASSFRFRPWKCETQLHRPRTLKGHAKVTTNTTAHKKIQTHTHTHTQRSVQVSLTISGCTVSTDFSWVSRNYFAPPFSTPWRSCLCSFTFPRFFCWGNCPPLELHQQSTVWFWSTKTTVRIGSPQLLRNAPSLANPIAIQIIQHHSAKTDWGWLGPLDLSSFALHPAAGINRWKAQTAAWPGRRPAGATGENQTLWNPWNSLERWAKKISPIFQDIQAAAGRFAPNSNMSPKSWGKFGTPKSYSLHDPLTHINSTDSKLLGLCELSMVEQSYGKVQVKHVVGIHLDGLAARLAKQAILIRLVYRSMHLGPTARRTCEDGKHAHACPRPHLFPQRRYFCSNLHNPLLCQADRSDVNNVKRHKETKNI